MILGDSLLVMTSLAEKEGLKGKVQIIYLDPPYGIKFGSNWQVSTRKRDVKDGKAEDATRQPEQMRAFRDTWKLGIHSYLAYLRDRLVVARDLLTETGSVFVQIGDENVHLVRCVLDEVFGSENFASRDTVSRKDRCRLASNVLRRLYAIISSGTQRDAKRLKYRPTFVAIDDCGRALRLGYSYDANGARCTAHSSLLTAQTGRATPAGCASSSSPRLTVSGRIGSHASSNSRSMARRLSCLRRVKTGRRRSRE